MDNIYKQTGSPPGATFNFVTAVMLCLVILAFIIIIGLLSFLVLLVYGAIKLKN